MITTRTESACNGCGECIHCGRRFKSYTVYECECGNESYDPEEDGWDMDNELCCDCREEEEEDE